MQVAEAIVRTIELMEQHGLVDWRFDINGRFTSCAGRCVYGKKVVELGHDFVVNNTPERVEITILHEIAHALVGPGHGHDYVWQQKCLEIGGNGQAKHNHQNTVKGDIADSWGEYNRGDTIYVRFRSGIEACEFYGYKSRNQKYPVLVLRGRRNFKVARHDVVTNEEIAWKF